MSEPDNPREAVARLLAKHVREINRVIASGMHEGDAIYAATDAILSLPALSVPEGWVAVPREVVEPFARAADWEERCIDPDYGIARVRPLKDSRRVAVTLGECRAVRAALPALSVPEGWRPIETAPRDGTSILAFCVHPNARWAGEDFAEWTEIVTTRWIDHNGGGWTWNGLCGVHTHWMPLPAPPLSAIPSPGGEGNV